ncbi:protein ENTREP2-like isoform X2 [Branchiostoma lanceolatum]|uniref:protein ENTREP2-like isoform X2 n=1 Tax=Branchiostoma lanceolatum TaxID=7740 RepID=UPI003451672D
MYSVNQSTPVRLTRSKYVVAGARGLGACHIVFGSLLLTFGIAGSVINTAAYFAETPIWTGLMYLVTGILGVVSSHKHTKCTVVGFLVMSCICLLMVLSGIISASAAISTEPWNVNPGPIGCWYDWDVELNVCKHLNLARSLVDAVVLLCTLVELGLCIASVTVTSYTLTNGCCACCVKGNTQQPYQVLSDIGPRGHLQPPPQNVVQFDSRTAQVVSPPGQQFYGPQGGTEQGAGGHVVLAGAQPPQRMELQPQSEAPGSSAPSPPPTYSTGQ